MTDDNRSFPARPIVGVGAVVVDDGRVLLVKRAQAPLKGEWSLPGGAVEVGETLSAAVQREVLEETGLVVSVGPIVEVLDRIHTDGDGRVEYHYVLIDYACTVVGGDWQRSPMPRTRCGRRASSCTSTACQPATARRHRQGARSRVAPA